MTDVSNANSIIAEDDLISLKRLSAKDVTERYVSWLNCPDINKFLECRHRHHTLESTRVYVDALGTPDSDEKLYGIYLRRSDMHIGNIKLGPINSIHRHASVGLLIGEPGEWGKGYGSRAIRLLTDYALNQLNLESLNAGCYSENIGSYKSFLKAGWEISGELKSHWIDITGRRTNELILTFHKPQFLELPENGGLTLIGGGTMMVAVAKYLRRLGFFVFVVLSPRHNDDHVREELVELGCSVAITTNLNTDMETLSMLRRFSRICICFGPAWIFSDEVVRLYEGRIFNFNGIPIPNYQGGAHFTWQILNRNKRGGAYIQQISTTLDRGLVVDYEDYCLPDDSECPLDYEVFNYEKATCFLRRFIDKHIVQGAPIEFCRQQPNWDESTYFPRLSTTTCAWIDWNWDGLQIADFCNAFSEPYPGARSLIKQNVVILKSVQFNPGSYFHPYCYGLIINKNGARVRIATKGGILEASLAIENSQASDVSIAQGDRFVTPVSKLEKAKDRVRYNSSGIAVKNNG